MDTKIMRLIAVLELMLSQPLPPERIREYRVMLEGYQKQLEDMLQ